MLARRVKNESMRQKSEPVRLAPENFVVAIFDQSDVELSTLLRRKVGSEISVSQRGDTHNEVHVADLP